MEPDEKRAPWPQPGPPPETAAEAAVEAAVETDLAEEPRREVEVPEPPSTGDPTVDAAAREAAAARNEPLEAQLTAYERAHRTLQDRLADVEG